MGFTCGIIGLPNVGKSTLFNALTAAGAEVANYPFCTISPNRGVTPVPDVRLEKLATITAPKKVTPTHLEFLDIAGLVAGAHEGEGLGNQFLSHIRTVDAVAHVVRAFGDENVSHVYTDVDPRRDVDVVNTELLLADLDAVERRLQKVSKMALVGDKPSKEELPRLNLLRDALAGGIPARRFISDPSSDSSTDPIMIRIFAELPLLTARPTIFIVNADEDALREDNAGVRSLRELAADEEANVVVIAAALEAEILQLDDPDERQLFYDEMGLTETGLNLVIRAGYDLLDLITFYTTVGPELRAWTIKRGALAPQAAGRIHTDFEKGFIRAEVIHWDDFNRLGDEHNVRDAGLMHVEGRDYVVQDGDIIRFRFNV